MEIIMEKDNDKAPKTNQSDCDLDQYLLLHRMLWSFFVGKLSVGKNDRNLGENGK